MTGIAIVGRGFMGSTHAQALASLGRSEQIKYIVVRSVLDNDKGREPGTIEAAPAATLISDFDVVLNDPDIGVVSICTPTGTHRELAVRALHAGKNVLLEKPIALTLDDSKAIYEAASLSGKVLMVAQVVRFFDGYRQLRRDVDDGKLGRVLSARATRFGNRPDWADWLRDYAEAGGMLVDFGIHDFDQMNLLLGDPVEVSTRARGTFGPVETTISYRDGGLGQVLSFADLRIGLPFRSSIEVLGTEGFARYDYAAEPPKMRDGDTASVDPLSRYLISTPAHDYEVQLVHKDPYARQFEYFLNCVEKGTQPDFCSTSSAVLALEVALAATKSIEVNAPVLIVRAS